METDISWDAIVKGDYEITKVHAYNARSYIKTAFQYYQDIQAVLRESEKKYWQTVFELWRINNDLAISTNHWYVAVYNLEKVTDIQYLIELELHVRRTEELSNSWGQYTTKLEFIKRTQPNIGVTDEAISSSREWYVMLDALVEDYHLVIDELKQEVQEYIPVDDKIIPHLTDMPPVREEILPRSLAQFFNGFDIDGNMELDLVEAQDFFFWIEKNIIYRWDCEKAHLEPGFFPGFPVGDGRYGFDYWQTPHETWMERAGDCEDMAIIQVAFFNHFRITAFMALVNVQGREIDHAIAIVLMGGTPEDYANLLGGLVYYEFDGEYYMLLDNAYSDAFGYLCGGLIEGQFEIYEIIPLSHVMP